MEERRGSAAREGELLARCAGERAYLASEIFEDVRLENHVDVNRPDDEAQLAGVDIENSLDVLWRGGHACRRSQYRFRESGSLVLSPRSAGMSPTNGTKFAGSPCKYYRLPDFSSGVVLA